MINKKTINIVSIAIPIAVALILGIRQKIDLGLWTKTLPHVIGVINTLTTIGLVVAVVQIKKGNKKLHEQIMNVCFGLGALFLVCYVTYHVSNPSTHFGSENRIVKYLYYFVLISHILVSLIVLPFVLRAYFYGKTGDFVAHKKTVKWAFPFWLYVSVTGVLAYLMIAPYYA